MFKIRQIILTIIDKINSFYKNSFTQFEYVNFIKINIFK